PCVSPVSPLFSPASHPPRDLPSFPTRRSSDLRPALRHAHAHGRQDDALQIHHQERRPAPRQNRHLHAQAGVRRQRFRHAHASEQDRKSTRLNSSHVKISYAVFCLKKKTIASAT